ncbi:MAG: hypothetical protein ACOYN0_15450 [Phycisphaerales bacterium]
MLRCVFCGPKPLREFERFEGGKIRDGACEACRTRQFEHERRRREKAEQDRVAALARREAELKAARDAEARELRERQAAEAALQEVERRERQEREEERRAAESKRAAEEACRARAAAEERRRAEEAAKAEEERIQAQMIFDLAMRASVWPGASEEQAKETAEMLVQRVVQLSDQLAEDLASAKREVAAADVGASAAEIAGRSTALVSILGQLHPLLGLAGVVVAASAAPVAKAVKESRGKHYRSKCEAGLGSLRPPEKDLLSFVIQVRHPELVEEVKRVLS